MSEISNYLELLQSAMYFNDSKMDSNPKRRQFIGIKKCSYKLNLNIRYQSINYIINNLENWIVYIKFTFLFLLLNNEFNAELFRLSFR